MKAEAKLVVSDDGIFWIEPKSFQYAFTHYEILMYDNYQTTALTQNSGPTLKQYNYVINNPVQQQVVIAVDYGAPRMLPKGCERKVHYNMYMYHSSGERKFGPVDISQ